MTIQSLHIIFLALTPTERWNVAGSPFKSIYSVDGLSIVILIVSVIVVCWLCAKHKRSERRFIQKITELIATNENLHQQNAELTAKNEKLQQEDVELKVKC